MSADHIKRDHESQVGIPILSGENALQPPPPPPLPQREWRSSSRSICKANGTIVYRGNPRLLKKLWRLFFRIDDGKNIPTTLEPNTRMRAPCLDRPTTFSYYCGPPRVDIRPHCRTRVRASRADSCCDSMGWMLEWL